MTERDWDDFDDRDDEARPTRSDSGLPRRYALALILVVMLVMLGMFLFLISRIQKAVERVGVAPASSEVIVVGAIAFPGQVLWRQFAAGFPASGRVSCGSTSSDATAGRFNSSSITLL
jgi:hypothetical protein